LGKKLGKAVKKGRSSRRKEKKKKKKIKKKQSFPSGKRSDVAERTIRKSKSKRREGPQTI